ncbi:hypothetical protein HNQ80_005055 [Anaerosolibacter carboniphilus]|uniref:Uncharacterized protein n=1 Tax=Anaerosolibacter carboniphilus TaxID=1417629 RepID=A0A841L3Y4_9FIRM|nr:hypothetical protein [Anaerosolibacter carboniphilus]MBB6218880.1 hypothetical protein [Anaerosolibacter carboniphilus]
MKIRNRRKSKLSKNGQGSIKQQHKLLDYIEKIKERFKIQYIIIAFIFGLVGHYSDYLSIKNGSMEMAREKFTIGKRYFIEDKDYNNAIKNFSISYKNDKHIENLLFYYVFALKCRGNQNDGDLAKKLLVENYEYLNMSEKAMLGIIEYENNNLEKAYKILDNIENPMQLDINLLDSFLDAYSNTVFKLLDYDSALQKIQRILLLLETNINEPSNSSQDKKFTVLVTPINYNANNLIYNQNQRLIGYMAKIGNTVFNYSYEKQDTEIMIRGLLISSKALNSVYMSKEDKKDFFENLNYVLSYGNNFSNINFNDKNINDDFKEVLENVIQFNELSNDNDSYMNAEKLKFIYNCLVDTYNLQWEKYDIIFNEDVYINYTGYKATDEYGLSRISLSNLDYNDGKPLVIFQSQNNVKEFNGTLTIKISQGEYDKEYDFRIGMISTNLANLSTEPLYYVPNLSDANIEESLMRYKGTSMIFKFE